MANFEILSQCMGMFFIGQYGIAWGLYPLEHETAG